MEDRNGIEWNEKWKHVSALHNRLTRLDIEILTAIAMGVNKNKELHEKMRRRKGKEIPKSTVSRHTTRLKKLGLISQTICFNSRFFELTETGSVTVSIFQREGHIDVDWGAVRGHDFGFKCKILRKPRVWRSV